MIAYLRIAMAVIALLGLLGENFWVYRKGQASIISNVVAGAVTTAKQQDQAATVAVEAATAATTLQDTIKQTTHVRHEKLQASVTADPRASCVLSPDELLQLQQAVAGTAVP